MYNDYAKSENIAHDWIRWPCVRVSSAEVPSFLAKGVPLGKWYETWVFSDCPLINTTQVIFKAKHKCLKAHKHIVRNVKNLIKKETEIMQNGFKSKHKMDKDGNPAGGLSTGKGIKIEWQDGPLGRDKKRTKPNGAFVEDVIAIAIDRIEYYQDSKFACTHNARALVDLKSALKKLNKRTADRERRGVEGTHEE